MKKYHALVKVTTVKGGHIYHTVCVQASNRLYAMDSARQAGRIEQTRIDGKSIITAASVEELVEELV